MEKDLLKDQLIEYGTKLGFGIIRVTTCEPLKLWNYQRNIRKKQDPDSAYLWDNLKYDPKEIMPEARSIVVAIWAHTPYKSNFPKGIGRFSAYYREYPKGRQAAYRLGKFLEQAGYNTIVQPNLPAKEIAYRAGIGYFGKNALIHTQEYGSWISLHYILTDAPLTPDESMDRISDCGDCNLCMRTCPTSAIQREGQVIPSKCIRHHMLSSDFVPVDIREKMGSRMLGCDICQMVCPFNKKGILEAGLPSPEEMDLFNIKDILKEWSTGLKNRMNNMGELIGKNYARAQKILSMAVILAGNSKDKSYIPYLIPLLKHPHAPIRGHSAWAIGKIKADGFEDILNKALIQEKDNRVREEIDRALGY
ncbi:MAG: 4Fe-4S double cluster binding domain-containing protein [Caldicoprobacterales bacterium]|jgi:epoxyqueuosine reductase|nr:hypothetical protein [Clostridiales bacterium]